MGISELLWAVRVGHLRLQRGPTALGAFQHVATPSRAYTHT
eukprot:NODE_8734_length_345_cov_76.378378_g6976_i0.p3 GENE.NODE_8734_length_345_cov_76.378378_g6976_i0~~NODE_8734_length_345_cov_76.378378_g6976_i0.p3  ORF type:complete len:51 (+),score=13.27 NODE_8734_length_345_cov_76.378378_g6976_i0:32-154(+)